jgi:hypothetical protein
VEEQALQGRVGRGDRRGAHWAVLAGIRGNGLDHARSHEWNPLPLGVVTAGPEITLLRNGRRVALETGQVRNLFLEVEGDVARFVEGLLRVDRAMEGEP